jgi:hypothetical protein
MADLLAFMPPTPNHDQSVALNRWSIKHLNKRHMMMSSRYAITALFLSCSFAAFAENAPNAIVTNGYVTVTTPGGKKQTVAVKDAISDSNIKFIDLPFKGQKDLMVLRDRGVSQEFYDVYLYSVRSDRFVYNKSLSAIPCLGVDVKTKKLVGQCFHASACKNWEEYYSVAPDGQTSLFQRRGTYCDPATGQAYEYIDMFRKGRRVSSYTALIR